MLCVHVSDIVSVSAMTKLEVHLATLRLLIVLFFSLLLQHWLGSCWCLVMVVYFRCKAPSWLAFLISVLDSAYSWCVVCGVCSSLPVLWYPAHWWIFE
jgi:hypothetical protein